MNTTKFNGIVQTYLNFDGRCEEALEFYKQAVGAEVDMLMRFKDAPQPCQAESSPASDKKVMHSSFRIGQTTLMASDGRCTGKTGFQGVSLTLNPPTEAEADKIFNALADGGQIQMPLSKTFYSPRFGMVADRFGVTWMIMVPQDRPK
jgi:PhnB protein